MMLPDRHWVADPDDASVSYAQLAVAREQVQRMARREVVARRSVVRKLERKCELVHQGFAELAERGIDVNLNGYCYVDLVPEEYRSTVSRLGFEPRLSSYWGVVEVFRLQDELVYLQGDNDGVTDLDLVFHTTPDLLQSPVQCRLGDLPMSARIGASVPRGLSVRHGSTFQRTTQFVAVSCEDCGWGMNCSRVHYRDQVLHGCAVHGLPYLGSDGPSRGASSTVNDLGTNTEFESEFVEHFDAEARKIAGDVAAWAEDPNDEIPWETARGVSAGAYRLCMEQCVQPVLDALDRYDERKALHSSGALDMVKATEVPDVLDSILLRSVVSSDHGVRVGGADTNNDVGLFDTAAWINEVKRFYPRVTKARLIRHGWGSADPGAFPGVYEKGRAAFEAWVVSRFSERDRDIVWAIDVLGAVFRTSLFGRMVMAEFPTSDHSVQAVMVVGALKDVGDRQLVEYLLDNTLSKLWEVIRQWSPMLWHGGSCVVEVDPFGLKNVPVGCGIRNSGENPEAVDLQHVECHVPTVPYG